MAEKTKVNVKRLWELAQKGLSARELMEKLDISDMQALKRSLDELMREKGETVNVPGLRDDAGLRTTYSDQGVRVPPAMLEGTGFNEGDLLNLKVEKNRITLEKAGPDPTLPV